MYKRPSKHSYFMAIADVVKTRSPDPKTQVGAVLVDSVDRIVGTGYNGPPAGSNDNIDWFNRDEALYQKIVHAEMNAILYSGARYDERAKLYCTMSPCKDCLKLIAASGIKTIFYRERYKDFVTVSQLASEFGVQLTQHEVHEDG